MKEFLAFVAEHFDALWNLFQLSRRAVDDADAEEQAKMQAVRIVSDARAKREIEG